MKLRPTLIVFAACGITANAVPLTWDTDPATTGAQGGAGTWTNGTNNWWDGTANASWNNTTPDTATFSGTGGVVTVDAAGITAGGVTVGSTGYSFTGSGTLTLNGAVTSNVAATLGSPLALGASQTWTTTSAREITVTGPFNLGANTLTLSGANVGANYRLNGAMSGTGGITKNGTGALYMSGSHAQSGQTNVSSGYLEVSQGALSMSNSVLNLTSTDTRGVDIWAGKLTLRGLAGTGNIAANGTYNNGAAWWWTTSTDKVALSLNVPTGESYAFSGILKNATWAGSAVMTVEKTGPGTQTFSGANTFTGGLIVNGGRLSVGNQTNATGTAGGLGNLTAARNITVNNTGTLGITINNAFVNNSTVYPTAVMVVNAGGKLTTSRFNTIGPVNLNGGTLENTVASGTDNNYDGWNFAGVVTVGGSAASTISSTTDRANRLMASTTFNVGDATGDANADLMVLAPLGDRPNGAGTGGLTKTGAGTLRISSASTYTGATAVNAGALLLDGSLKSPVTVANGAVLAISGTGSVDAAITLGEGGILDTTAATGGWSPLNNRTLTAGRTTAPGTDITGNLTLLPGATLRVGVGVGATLTSANNLRLDGGRVAFDLTADPAGANDTVVVNGSLDIVSVSEIQLNPADLALGNGIYPLVAAAGGIVGSAGDLTATGLPAAGGRQTFTLSTTTVANTLTLNVTGTAATLVWNNFSGTGKWNTSDVNWRNGAANDRFFNGDLVRLEDTANGTENIDIDTAVEGVAIQAVNTGSTTFVLGGSGKITGSTPVNLTGGGILRLANTGGNDFTGAVTVENGSTLQVADSAALPLASVVTLNGATLDIGATTGVMAGSVVLTNGSTLAGTTGTLEPALLDARGGLVSADLAGTGVFSVTNNSTAGLESSTALTSAITVANGSTLELLSGAAVTGNIAVSGILKGAAASGATVNGTISGSGALQQTGSGTLALAGAQTYAGPTTVNAGVLDLATGDAKLYSDTYRTTTLAINTGGTVRAGRINYGGANHLGQLTHNSPNNVINGGTLHLVSASDTSGRGWTIGAAGATLRTDAASVHTWSPNNEAWTQIDLNNGGAVLTFDIGGDFILRSTIMDFTGTPGGTGGISVSNGSVVKTGPGTLTFGTQTLVAAAGSHKYTGTTSVLQGTLVLDASLGTSPVSVAAGATLSIGTTLATVGCGPLTLASSSTLKIEGNSTTQAFDVLNVAGGVDLNGATLNFTDSGNSTLTTGTRFPILTYTGALTGTFAGLAEGGTFGVGSNTFRIRYSDGSRITLEAVSTGGYATWSTDNAPTGTAADDFDGDGVSNGVEYVLGGDKNTNDNSRLPTVHTTPGGDFVFSFVRGQASKTTDTTVRILVGTDLLTWPLAYDVATAPEVGTTDNGNGTETVTLTIPRAPDTRKFARLAVEIN